MRWLRLVKTTLTSALFEAVNSAGRKRNPKLQRASRRIEGSAKFRDWPLPLMRTFVIGVLYPCWWLPFVDAVPRQDPSRTGGGTERVVFVVGLAVSSHQQSINASKYLNWEASMLLAVDIGCGSKRRRRLHSATTSFFMTLWWRSTTSSASFYSCTEMFDRPLKAPSTPSLFSFLISLPPHLLWSRRQSKLLYPGRYPFTI